MGVGDIMKRNEDRVIQEYLTTIVDLVTLLRDMDLVKESTMKDRNEIIQGPRHHLGDRITIHPEIKLNIGTEDDQGNIQHPKGYLTLLPIQRLIQNLVCPLLDNYR